MAAQAPVQNTSWVAPAFAGYQLATALQLTNWLYMDAAQNPAAGTPEQWPNVGVVVFRDRVVSLPAIAPGGTAVKTLDLTGGRNCVVFTRSAVAGPAPGNRVFAGSGYQGNLPSFYENYIALQVQRQDRYVEQEFAMLGNDWGIAGEPFVLQVPELWIGKMSRTWTARNSSASQAFVEISYQVAVLDTGR